MHSDDPDVREKSKHNLPAYFQLDRISGEIQNQLSEGAFHSLK